MEWFSWVIAIGVGISAVISPIITAYINNKNQIQIKNIEIYELAKRKCLEDFIKSAVELHESNALISIENYHNSVNKLYIYFKKVPDSINSLAKEFHNSSSYFEILNHIVKSLSEQIAKD